MMSAYDFAYQILARLEAYFEAGYYLRDADGAQIMKLSELLAAIEAGRWPV